jgi:CheY-like chemotaxis protein
MPDARKLRALVVEDNHDIAQALAALVRTLGHESDIVTDPTVAVDTALARRPDIAFVDLAMPHLNGYELAQRLRRHFPRERLGLVAVSASGDEHARTRSRRSGFDAHVTKPLDAGVIESIIDVVGKQLD